MTSEEMDKYGIRPAVFRFDVNERVRVESRGGGLWAVVEDGAFCLDKESDEFVYEPLSSNRTEEFMARTRFTLDEALRRAVKKLGLE